MLSSDYMVMFPRMPSLPFQLFRRTEQEMGTKMCNGNSQSLGVLGKRLSGCVSGLRGYLLPSLVYSYSI